MRLITIVALAGCGQSEGTINKLYPDLLLTMETLDFGDVVRDYPLALDLPVTNSGPVTLHVSGVEITGEDAADFTVLSFPEEVPAGETLGVEISFKPPSYLDYSAVVTVQSDDPEGAEIAALIGSGVKAPTPDISFNPDVVDFGVVAVGAFVYQTLEIQNLGDDTLLIGSLSIDGNPAFTADLPPSGVVAGGSHSIGVYYQPSQENGDSAVLTVSSDDPDEPEASVIILGNGGGDYECPVPVITGATTAAPMDSIRLSGSDSYDPDGEPLADYEWTVTRGASTVELVTGDANQSAYLTFFAAGTYEVELKVTDAYGVSCEPALHTIEVIPTDLMHIELLWDTGAADVDLHLIEEGGSFFLMPGDCNWCNQSPNWGGVGGGDDPTLTLDDKYGYGPENITVDTPAEGEYMVRVHYYNSNGDGDVVATLNVYLRGILAGTWSKVLTNDDVWEVVNVTWSDDEADTFLTEKDIALYNASRSGCYEE